MALSLSGNKSRGPRRGAKGSCGTPGTPSVISPFMYMAGTRPVRLP
jgi:hypothetical protein